MWQFAEARQRIRALPRSKRLILVIFPLIAVGVIDVVKSYRRGDFVELVAVAAIFFIIAPMFAVWWDRRNYR